MHLYAANALPDAQVPAMWPTRAFFEHRYRAKEQDTDIRLIYTLTELPEVPVSIQEAAAIGDADLIISILEKGVEVDWREDGWLKTALHRAAISGHADVVELLLVKGADTNARDSFGSIALHYAAEKGHKQIAELLIDRGADVNARRSWPAGDTPLHEAVRAEHEDIVRLLIDNGADVNVKNNKGLTPADVAVGRSRRMVTPLTPVAKLLIAKGADISVVSAVHMEDLDEAR